MNKKNNIIQTALSVALVVMVLLAIGAVAAHKYLKNSTTDMVTNTPSVDGSGEYCFYDERSAGTDLYDVYALRMSVDNQQRVSSGLFRTIPAQKDRKVGSLTGTITSLSLRQGVWAADLWWNTMAEGMRNTEQLWVQFDDAGASVVFGQMVDRGDGVYVYQTASTDQTSTLYIPQLPCEQFDDKLLVADYLRANIAKLSPVSPVLGGSWYVVSVLLDTDTHTGTVVYEDGHIQQRGMFTYTRTGTTVNAQITNTINE